MVEPVAKRIELIMNKFNLNKNSFSKAIGMTNNVTIGRIIDEKRDPSYQVLVKIIQTFGSIIDTRWLLTGEGEMYVSGVTPPEDFTFTPELLGQYSAVLSKKTDSTLTPRESKKLTPTLTPSQESEKEEGEQPTVNERHEYTQFNTLNRENIAYDIPDDYRESNDLGMPRVITVDSVGKDNVTLVPVRARAGYLSGYGDPEYISDLPVYSLPNLKNGTFRAFEVEGHSMSPTLKNHDIVVGEWVENLDHIRDDRVHIIVTKDQGILVKRVINRISKYNLIVCKSDAVFNKDHYPNIQVNPNDILEVWYGRLYISADFRAPNDMLHRLNDLEVEVDILKKKANF